MKRDDTVYLQHILDSIALIEEYTQGIEEVSFSQKRLIQDGVIRQIEIIGEAVKHLSAELRARYSTIPWQDIAGARDKLIHDYFGVDIEKVWLMREDDIPALKIEIKKIINDILGD
jgi:uncharacterized protein with HEPN domain